ncbi:hypothetical protein E2320_005112 [Naja naja]|nr:hypothetical protein E2320_005112 [Naja naja]
MTTTPSSPSFHPTTETWDSYINHFDCFLNAADLADISSHRKKVWNQSEGETLSMYMAVLKTAAFHCGFRDLDDMLLDQLRPLFTEAPPSQS